MNILANIISFLHLLFIIFVTCTPFITSNPVILLYYCFIIFFVAFHWYMNDDTCVLTIIESKLRGKKSTDTFMGQLLKPIYKVSETEIHLLTAGLFLIALYKSRIWESHVRELFIKISYYHFKIFYRNISNFFSPKSE